MANTYNIQHIDTNTGDSVIIVNDEYQIDYRVQQDGSLYSYDLEKYYSTLDEMIIDTMEGED